MTPTRYKSFTDFLQNCRDPFTNFTYSWNSDYTPKVEAYLGATDSELCVKMCAYESEILAAVTQQGGAVCTDSCLEFFFRPIASELAYFNFEVNPVGVMHLAYGSGRNDRQLIIKDSAYFQMQALPNIAAFNGEYWQVAYAIPFDFIKQYAPDFTPEAELLGNFYKCGDNTAHPHWGALFPIPTPNPDYHQPTHFK